MQSGNVVPCSESSQCSAACSGHANAFRFEGRKGKQPSPALSSKASPESAQRGGNVGIEPLALEVFGRDVGGAVCLLLALGWRGPHWRKQLRHLLSSAFGSVTRFVELAPGSTQARVHSIAQSFVPNSANIAGPHSQVPGESANGKFWLGIERPLLNELAYGVALALAAPQAPAVSCNPEITAALGQGVLAHTISAARPSAASAPRRARTPCFGESHQFILPRERLHISECPPR
jgi:hypothetical protein